ncbi:hypothetical protein CHS0354_042842 [Potamilus streckersoni]|uniref:Uncharacterized protein n=1 Tax=Potamilus streckersoni TaxID=2493646 RepID=A0AAE0T5V4_9BIVA|nr:hypothetical protein CHS0354_042842 [Potamilus streckersoni]
MSKRRKQLWDNERQQFDHDNPGSWARNHDISSLEADQESFHFVNRGRNRWQRREGLNRQRGHSGRAQRGSCRKKNGGYASSTDGANPISHDKNKIQCQGQNNRSGEKEDRLWENRSSGRGKRRGTYSRSRVSCHGRDGNRGRGREANTGKAFCFERFFEGMPESSSETSDYSGSEYESEFEGSTYRWRVRGRRKEKNRIGGRGGQTGGVFYSERFSEYLSGESEYEDSDRDDNSEFERPVTCPDENEVFEYFIKEVGCPSSLTNIANSSLFPKECNISGWFQSHQSRFILFERKGRIHFIVPFYKEATFCFSYNGLNKNNHCYKSDCPHAHVCKDFIGGSCKEGNKCQFSHNFLDGENSGLIYKLGLNMFSNDEIRLIYSHRFPRVCRKHLLEHICHRPVCAYLHICCDSLLGKCKLESTCPWGHSLRTVQNQYVLKAYNLAHWKEQLIKKIIFTPFPFITDSGNTTGKESSSLSSKESMLEKTKWYEYEHIKVAHSRNNLHEEQNRKPRSRSKSRDITHGRNRSSTSYSRQRCGQDTCNLREEHKSRCRSKSRDATEGHNRSSTPHRRYGQDILNLREEHKTRCRSKSRDATDGHKRSSTPYSCQRYGQDDFLNLQKEQKKKCSCRSKPRDASKECKSSPTSDLVLEMDTAQSNPVCDSYLVGKCKAAGCTYLHIDNIRLPYIWQIKISDKWLTLDKLQMNKVERDYCNKKSACQIMICYGGSNFTAMLTFPKTDIKTAVVTMKGQVPKSISVRRLSTTSYAEGTNLSGQASFKTQWRWFYLDDFGTWCLFESELLQFTLEQKYTRKCQETYLFCRQNFSYQIDFKHMKQTNMDTGKERELLRRPLFVSEDDVESKHYPVSISIPTGANTPFPSSWVPWDLAHKFELVKLQQDSTEFKGVEDSFFTTLFRSKFRINNICRVQNMDLWTAYCGQKKSMKGNLERCGQAKNVDERKLFHGTDSLDSVRGICTNCFDFRVCGKNGTVYGKGAYFACDASYSHNYTKSSVVTKERYMFLAEVLVGEYTTGCASYTRPPNKLGGIGHLLFDSCVDSMNNPSIFVVFDLKQCYPKYLICYINLEEVTVKEATSVRPNKNTTQHQSAQSASNLQRTYSSFNVNSSPAPQTSIKSILKNSSSFTQPASLQKTFSSSFSLIETSSSASTSPIPRSPSSSRGPSSDTVSHPASLQRTSSSSVKSARSASPALSQVSPSTIRGTSTNTVSHPASLQRTSLSSVKLSGSNSPASPQMSYSVTSSPSSHTVNHQVSVPRISSSSSPSVPSTNFTSSADLQRPHSVTSSSSSYTVNHSNFHTASFGVSSSIHSSQLPSHRSFDYNSQMSQGKSNNGKKSDCCIL